MVISLGGSQIIKNGKINVKFLLSFRKVLKKHSREYKFIVVCGGGSVARMYIEGLQKIKRKIVFQNFAGISATRTNARFMNYFFEIDPKKGIPHKMKEVKKLIRKQDVIFCGALEYHLDQTSDSTAAQIAKVFGSEFINITNIAGLYTDNPLTNKKAKFIPAISWLDFYKIASKLAFKPGQHFVLDQKAAKIIMDQKIKTYIVGQNIKNLDFALKGKEFKGTLISD